MCLLFPALLILVNFIGPDSYRGTLVPHVLFELLFKRRKQQVIILQLYNAYKFNFLYQC